MNVGVRAMGRVLNPKIIELEGMAMAGLLRKAYLKECEDKSYPEDWKKIIVETEDGKVLETNCMEPDAAKRNYMVFTLYIRSWGKSISTGEER
jgi:hypothetical protein